MVPAILFAAFTGAMLLFPHAAVGILFAWLVTGVVLGVLQD